MTDASGIAADRLKSFISRVERLEEEKAAIANDIKEVFAEAKSAGFETKIMKMIIKLRKMDSQERAEQEQLLEVYAQACGLAYTPLGDAAAEREKAAAPKPHIDTDAEQLAKARDVLLAKPRNDDGKISGCTSYVQRMLHIAYNPASRIMDALEQEGFVGAPNAAGARSITAPPEPISPTNLPPSDVTPYDPGTGVIFEPKSPDTDSVGSAAFGETIARTATITTSGRDPSVNSAIDFLKRDMNRAAAAQ